MPALALYILISILVSLSATTIAAPTVNLQSDKASYSVGEKITLSITLSDSPMIYGGGLDLTFNPVVVNADSSLVDTSWDFTIKDGIIDNATGAINDIFFTHFSGLEGSLPVAIIVLNAVAVGSAGITVAESASKPFTDTGGKSVTFSISNQASAITVTAATDDEDTDTDTDTDQTTTDQADSDQTESEQTSAEQLDAQQSNTGNNRYDSSTDSSSDKGRYSGTENTRQDNNYINNEHRNSDSSITNTQQAYTENSSSNKIDNSKNPLTTNPEAKKSFEASSLSSSTNNGTSIRKQGKESDKGPILFITFTFLILAFVGYKVFVYSKK